VALSTEDAARLAALRTAYDQLIMGANVVRVQLAHGGRLTDFGPGDAARLKQEIDRLETLDANPCARRRGALRFRIR
jgi:hypothetical protein